MAGELSLHKTPSRLGRYRRQGRLFFGKNVTVSSTVVLDVEVEVTPDPLVPQIIAL